MSPSALSCREQNPLRAAMPLDDWRSIESHREWVDIPVGSSNANNGGTVSGSVANG